MDPFKDVEPDDLDDLDDETPGTSGGFDADDGIDEPTGGAYYGGTVAAPVFSATMSGALRILNITPDDMPSMKIAGATAAAPEGATP